MSQYKDKTTLDNNRRLLNLQRAEVENVLPEYFAQDFPNLIKLFDAYYDWLNKEGNFGDQIQKLHRNRDATQVPGELLPYLEDELLLGKAYFGGFINKREAIKFSNLLYRSKGTKYSIEQFFRGFYGIDPQIKYPKENIFKVGPEIDYNLDSVNSAGTQIKTAASKIGAESQRYITDDKRYQVLSVLIKSNIPITEWEETYKLFVHPAGYYISGELVLELINGNVIQSVRESGAGIPVEATFETELFSSAISSQMYSPDITLIEAGDGAVGMLRTRSDLDYGKVALADIEDISSTSLRDLLSPNSYTLDDSDLTSGYNANFFMNLDSIGYSTFDQHSYQTLFDADNSADSAHYPFQHV